MAITHADFETKDIIQPLMDFVKQCPFLEEYSIDFNTMGVKRLTSAKPDASSFDYVGSGVVSDIRDLLTKRYTARQANFQLWMLRNTTHDLQREEVANFLYNFEMWVEFCQAYDLVPKLSDTNEGQYEELMWADNGAYFAEWEGETSSLYVVQLHITYYTTYNKHI